jgi:hypothetical protein
MEAVRLADKCRLPLVGTFHYEISARDLSEQETCAVRKLTMFFASIFSAVAMR